MDDGAGRFALPASHLQGIDDEFGTDVVGDRPTDDTSGPGVDDRAAVDPAVGGAMLRDVGEPDTIWPIGTELALHEVIVRGRQAAGTLVFPLMRDAVQARLAHQAGDPFASDPDSHAEA